MPATADVRYGAYLGCHSVARHLIFFPELQASNTPGADLTEAMALGIPVVSTDCPSGPRELIDAGRIAPLVKMGDVDALASALLLVLAEPPRSEVLTEAVSAYHQDVSAAAYLQTLGLST